jgi:Ca2+-binding RTX toxin-like protein
VDRLFGGSNNDFLDGGSSGDRMHGGTGQDTFRVQKGFGYDKVLDFTDGQDRILLGNGSAGVSVTNAFGNAYVYQGADLLARVNGAAGDLQLSGSYLV